MMSVIAWIILTHFWFDKYNKRRNTSKGRVYIKLLMVTTKCRTVFWDEIRPRQTDTPAVRMDGITVDQFWSNLKVPLAPGGCTMSLSLACIMMHKTHDSTVNHSPVMSHWALSCHLLKAKCAAHCGDLAVTFLSRICPARNSLVSLHAIVKRNTVHGYKWLIVTTASRSNVRCVRHALSFCTIVRLAYLLLLTVLSHQLCYSWQFSRHLLSFGFEPDIFYAVEKSSVLCMQLLWSGIQ